MNTIPRFVNVFRLNIVIALALASASLTAAQSSKQIIGADSNSQAVLSPAVKAGGFIYVSGTGGLAGGKNDIRGQSKATLDSLSARLKEAGSSLANAVNVSVYLTDAGNFAPFNEVYSSYWPRDPPARTTVIVAGTPADNALVEISLIAVPSGAERLVVTPGGWTKSSDPYSYAIKSGNTLFLAGLVSRSGKRGANMPGDISTQMKVVLDNGAAILKEARMSYADVAQARVYLTDARNFQAMNKTYLTYFHEAPPARSTVKAALYSPDYLVEIGMIAVKDAARQAITTPGADGTPGIVNQNLSSAIRAGNRLFVSGITGNIPGNAGDARAQAAELLARVASTVKAAGFGMSDVVEGMGYVVDKTKFGEVNAAYRQAFQKDFPARTAVSVGLMGEAEVEFSFIAAK